jgi:CRP-like cAMP-binding protein
MMQNGMSMEFAITGNEGVIGVASFLGGGSTPSESVVLIPGHAYRLGAAQVQDEFERYGALSRLLLRYTQALTTQTGQSAVCNRHHSLEQRLCTWILSCQDRLPAGELTVTQEVIGKLLGARREGINATAAGLQRKGLIRSRRGCIAVLDRPQLEARACECYAVVKREYARLLPPNRVRQRILQRLRENPDGLGAVFRAH